MAVNTEQIQSYENQLSDKTANVEIRPSNTQVTENIQIASTQGIQLSNNLTQLTHL